VVEVALELLVGQVDAELLEAVGLKILEAEDVEDANVELVAGGVGLQVVVESVHDPAEESGVQSLGQPVSHVHCLGAFVTFVHRFSWIQGSERRREGGREEREEREGGGRR